MGRFFSTDQIRRNLIPTLEAFDEVALEVRNRLQDGSDGVLTACFYGSYAWGDFNIRSDLDCFVITRRSGQAVNLTAGLVAFASSRHIKLKFACQGSELLETPLVHVRNLGEHLWQLPLGSSIVGMPDLMLESLTASAEDRVNYIGHQLGRFETAVRELWDGNEELPSLLEKLYSGSVHIARKMLSLKLSGDSGWDRREPVLKQYTEHYPQAAPMLRQLMDWDDHYTQFVQAPRRDWRQHERLLSEMIAPAKNAVDFAAINAELAVKYATVGVD